jgi:hypothetical protein
VPSGKSRSGNAERLSAAAAFKIELLGISLHAGIFGILAAPFINHPLPLVQLPRYVA